MRHARALALPKIQVAVDIVADNIYPAFQFGAAAGYHLSNLLECLGGIDMPGGIIGRVDHHRSGIGGNSGLQRT